MRTTLLLWPAALLFLHYSILPTLCAQPPTQPKAVPTTRAEMLTALEALKLRTSRLPLPAASDESSATSELRPPSSLGVVNNGRMRNAYLPSGLRGGGPARQPDPAMQFDQVFATELFWIVSRVNNCHYCLGHQEAKLKAAGVPENRLLQLDTDWPAFPAAERLAFAFAKKLTYAPHRIMDEDVDRLRADFSDEQILEIAFLVGRFNSTNRWTDSLGIPQEEHRDFKSELAQDSLERTSQVAVLAVSDRAMPRDFNAWQSSLKQASKRPVRLKMESSQKDVPNYERLLSHFPVAGEQWLEQIRQAQIVGELSAELKENIAFVAALADEAWYMQHRSLIPLRRRGISDRDAFDFVLHELQPHGPTDSALNVALRFTAKLTVSPQAITDRDVERLLTHYTPTQVAEIVFHIGIAAFLDRVTEAAGLPWQDELADLP